MTRIFHINCGEIVLIFENIAMKRVMNSRKAKCFAMDIEWYTLGDLVTVVSTLMADTEALDILRFCIGKNI